jgi:hypothetical protein
VKISIPQRLRDKDFNGSSFYSSSKSGIKIKKRLHCPSMGAGQQSQQSKAIPSLTQQTVLP